MPRENARSRRRSKRDARPVTRELLERKVHGLEESIRKALSGGSTRGRVQEKVRSWTEKLGQLREQLLQFNS